MYKAAIGEVGSYKEVWIMTSGNRSTLTKAVNKVLKEYRQSKQMWGVIYKVTGVVCTPVKYL